MQLWHQFLDRAGPWHTCRFYHGWGRFCCLKCKIKRNMYIWAVGAIRRIQMYEHVGESQVFFPFFLKKIYFILLLALAFSEMPILIYAFLSKVGHSCGWVAVGTPVSFTNPSSSKERMRDAACWCADSQSGETTWRPWIFSSSFDWPW